MKTLIQRKSEQWLLARRGQTRWWSS